MRFSISDLISASFRCRGSLDVGLMIPYATGERAPSLSSTIPNPVDWRLGSIPRTRMAFAGASPGLREGGDLLFRDVEVGGDGLDVVVVLELLDEPQDLLGLLARDLDVVLGQETDLGGGHLDLGLLDGLEDRLILLGRGRDLEQRALVLEVVGAGREGDVHEDIL